MTNDAVMPIWVHGRSHLFPIFPDTGGDEKHRREGIGGRVPFTWADVNVRSATPHSQRAAFIRGQRSKGTSYLSQEERYG